MLFRAIENRKMENDYQPFIVILLLLGIHLFK